MPLLTDKTSKVGALFNSHYSTMTLPTLDNLKPFHPASWSDNNWFKCAKYFVSVFLSRSELQKRAGQPHGCSARVRDLLQVLLWQEIWAERLRIRTRSWSSELWSSGTHRRPAASGVRVHTAARDTGQVWAQITYDNISPPSGIES